MKRGRRYGVACLVCRRRKVRCDGRRPTCVNCERLNEDCHYKEQSAFTVQLSNELRSEKSRVEELENHIRELVRLDGVARDNLLQNLTQRYQLNTPEPSQPRTSTPQTSLTPSESEEKDTLESVSYDGSAQFSIDVEGKVRIASQAYFMC